MTNFGSWLPSVKQFFKFFLWLSRNYYRMNLQYHGRQAEVYGKLSACYRPPYNSFSMFATIPHVFNSQVTKFSCTFPRKCHFYVFETCSIWGNCKERRHRDDFFSDQSPPKYSEFWFERSVRQLRWIELKQCQQFRQCDEVHIASIIKLISD